MTCDLTGATYEVAATLRPVDVLTGAGPRTSVPPVDGHLVAVPRPAPYAAVRATLSPDARATARLRVVLRSGDDLLQGWWDPDTGAVGLEVTATGRTSTHVSRRLGRLPGRPEALALTLTGTHVTWLCHEVGPDGAQWVARARYDLRDRVDVHDEAWLAALEAGVLSGADPVVAVEAGGFGQLGVRDVRLVTTAEGEPVRDGEHLLLSATSAGPGFFDTAHTSLWRLHPGHLSLAHAGDLFFRRPDRPGAYGDHAVHVVRDGDRWLVAASTWADFDADRNPSVRVTLAETTADVVHGEHLLDTRELPLPVDGVKSVGVWDPHLLRDGDGWWVGYVSARKLFSFHPVLARGGSLESLSMVAAATNRRATEGTTLVRTPQGLRVLASDGRDNPRALRTRMPVFDTDLREVGTLAAPYPTNIPWPSVVDTEHGPLLISFDGTATGAAATGQDVLGYGTHGSLIVMRGR